MIFLGPALGLAAANFAYQFFGDANWHTAIDRTWFQTCAIATCWLTSLVPSRDRA